MDLNTPFSNTPSAGGGAGLDPSQFIQRALPGVKGRRDGEYQVVMGQSVLDEIHAHGQSRRDAEVCGVLVGLPCRDERGAYLHVEACIRGENATSASANVTFTAETWAHIQSVMDREHPDQKIVGWYHTHPGFGIFLSGMDLFIHQSFFDLPWQVAFEYDPVGGDEGVFVWEAGQPVRRAFLVQSEAGADDEPAAGDKRQSRGRMAIMAVLIVLVGLAAVAWAIWMLYWLGTDRAMSL